MLYQSRALVRSRPYTLPTTHWNYRVLRTDFNSDARFDSHEVYEADRIQGWTDDPVWPSGDPRAALAKTLGYMQQALERPVLRRVEDGGKTRRVEDDPLTHP